MSAPEEIERWSFERDQLTEYILGRKITLHDYCRERFAAHSCTNSTETAQQIVQLMRCFPHRLMRICPSLVTCLDCHEKLSRSTTRGIGKVQRKTAATAKKVPVTKTKAARGTTYAAGPMYYAPTYAEPTTAVAIRSSESRVKSEPAAAVTAYVKAEPAPTTYCGTVVSVPRVKIELGASVKAEPGTSTVVSVPRVKIELGASVKAEPGTSTVLAIRSSRPHVKIEPRASVKAEHGTSTVVAIRSSRPHVTIEPSPKRAALTASENVERAARPMLAIGYPGYDAEMVVVKDEPAVINIE
jgi:hypothetical protein